MLSKEKEIQHAMAAGYRMLEFWMKEDQKDPFFDKAEEVQIFHTEASIFENCVTEKDDQNRSGCPDEKSRHNRFSHRQKTRDTFGG